MGMLPYIIYAAFAGATGYTNSVVRPPSVEIPAESQHYLRGLFENDSVSGRDRNYTHGTRLDYARRMDNGHAWGLSLMQNMYTPETHTRHRVEGEHPYCGYSALGGAFLWRGVNFGCGTELQIGTTGRESCAGRFQNALHRAFDMETWDGWDDQIPAELTIQLTSRQEWRLAALERRFSNGWQTDSTFIVRESLGTFRIAGGAGLSFRIGKNLTPSMEATGNEPTYFGIGLLRKPDYDPSVTSYFLVSELYVDYVARDLTVDGGVFHHFERSCSRTPWQVRANVGVGVSHRGMDYYMGVSVFTRTYRTQDEASVMGTFAITWRW